MKNLLSRVMSDYGMILVLLLLCAFFSAVTYREQSPTGAAAGRQLAVAIKSEFRDSPSVMIAVRDLPDDVALAEELRRGIEAAGGTVRAVVKGEPKDARSAVQQLA